jgi:hypothetical protein
MKSTLLLVLFSAVIALAGFGPSVRIDHQYDPAGRCVWPAIAVSPNVGSGQPLYVVFEYDSAFIGWRADIMFQKSTDDGRTWLPADVVAGRGNPGAVNPDITTDLDGNIYVVYKAGTDTNRHVYCVRSNDGGATWSPPATVDDKTRGGIGWSRVAVDSAGNLLCAWNDRRTAGLHIWSSVSTDRGATWSQNVLVDDDTTNYDCFHAEVFVQPGTNHYLVAAEVPSDRWGRTGWCCCLYRSIDMGQSFQLAGRFDIDGAGQPHVVADAQHVVCDFSNGSYVKARTLYTQPDTWGASHSVGSSLQAGGLAISADGRVHAILQAPPPGGERFYAYYAFSSDHGVSWSDPELVNDDTTRDAYDPEIAADAAGHAYVVWRDYQHDEIWFATNDPVGVAEQPLQQLVGVQPSATIVRNFLLLPEAASHRPQAASLLDISGRRVQELVPGANDVRALAPGVYFVREQPQAASHKPQAVRKVVLTE